MQKSLLTLFLIVFTTLFSSATNSNLEKSQIINDNCTVTASWTAPGEDCFGNPIEVTATCTSSAATCSQAYSQAGGCAYTKANLGVLEISDCP